MAVVRKPSRLASRLLVSASVVLAASLTAAATVRQDTPKAPQENAIDNEAELARVGEETVNRACANQCHGLENLETRRTVAEWNSVVQEMVDRGAMVAGKDLAIAKQYLTRYYGAVAVNLLLARRRGA